MLEPGRNCNLCAAIPLEQLPSEEEHGYPHQPSLQALRASANTCSLCRLILMAVSYVKTDIDAESTGLPRATGGWTATVYQAASQQYEVTIKGHYSAGTMMCCNPNQLSTNPPTALQMYPDELSVRPWLYGNWWRFSEQSPASQLIGLGVRIAPTGHVNNVLSAKKDHITFRGSYLRIRVRDDSPMAYFIPGRIRAKRAASDITSQRVNSWVTHCNSHHNCMPKNTHLPTRVLDVRGELIKMVEISQQMAPYVALSHRWGQTHRLTLRKASHKFLSKGCKMDQLPQTFKDAIRITRSLCVAYLWIDSLCIIQDDKHDWEREAAKMSRVYADSYITIAASASENDASGVFPSVSTRLDNVDVSPESWSLGLASGSSPMLEQNPKDGAIGYSSKGPYAILSRQVNGCPSELAVSIEWMPSSRRSEPENLWIPGFGCPVDPPKYEPLASRGWTLQERALPSRILHYCKDQVYWECNQFMLGEDGSRMAPSDYRSPALTQSQLRPIERHGLGGAAPGLSLIEGYQTAPGSLFGRFKDGWPSLVENYCARQLTVDTDKLPAIAGLANQLAKATGDKYHAGVWRAHIHEDIFWRVYAREESRVQVNGGFEHQYGRVLCKPTRPSEYRAPTWSWASLNSLVKFIPLDYARLVAELVDCNTRPKGIDPFGAVALEAWVEFKAPLIQVSQAPSNFRPSPLDPLGFGALVSISLSHGTSYGEAYFDIVPHFPCFAVFLDTAHAILVKRAMHVKAGYVRVGAAKFLRTERQRQETMGTPNSQLPEGPIMNVDARTTVRIY